MPSLLPRTTSPWKWLFTAAVFTLPARLAAGSDASIYPIGSVPEWLSSAAITLQVQDLRANISTVTLSVAPLTIALGANESHGTRSPVAIVGDLIEATASNYAQIAGANQIAYLSCDSIPNSFIDANRIFNALTDNLPAAILLYSQAGNCCDLSYTDLLYQTVFTMIDMGEAENLLQIANNSISIPEAAISNTVSTSGSGGGGANSSVAMNILYGITGLIAVLFLIIIATGAVRAHRDPERYGPRSGQGGRPRQSRAKGLARAVLETLPIVKFGDDRPAKPDSSIELQSTPESLRGHTANEAQNSTLSTSPGVVTPHPESTHDIEQAVAADESDKGETGIGAARTITTKKSSAEEEEGNHLGCSICTEDFTVGEDVRVLPCNHKYHPHCVDPWLMNVSGTCPLCRLDLRPNNADADSSLAPPLDVEASTPGAGNRRRTRIFELYHLRYATAEERIEALRQYRAQTQAENGAVAVDNASAAEAGAAGEDHNRDRLSRRLRDKFRIRTRAQPPSPASSA
ncbi:hypothetical protein SEPCBS57363_003173 [Sporothrix epigloea]|uniref:RING-type E3 ubiquitin transferase n=1 Tax=Sporothrix epigloea TaxID=1892477 RepID=A0ABP0DK25_9PEZI